MLIMINKSGIYEAVLEVLNTELECMSSFGTVLMGLVMISSELAS